MKKLFFFLLLALPALAQVGGPYYNREYVRLHRRPVGGAWSVVGIFRVTDAGELRDTPPTSGTFQYGITTSCDRANWSSPEPTNYAPEFILTVNYVATSTGELSILTRAQPNSTSLVPTPELDGADNETPNLNLSRLPKFSMPTGITSEWFVGSIGAQNALTLLDHGITHTDELNLVNGGLNANGKASIGAQIPFNRRAKMLYNNVFHNTEAGRRYVGYYTGGAGYLPRNSGEESDIRLATLNGALGGLHFNDVTAAQRLWLNFEATNAPGVDAQAWENVKRDQMLNPLKQYRGTGNIPASHQVGFQGHPYNSAWGTGQDFFAEHGYHKTRYAYAYMEQQPDGSQKKVERFSLPHDAWDFYRNTLFPRQGAWVHHAVQNIEVGLAKGYPKPVPLMAPYHEDGQGDTDREGFWQFYKLRPDVAENWAPLSYLVGAKGTGLWNAPRPVEWKSSEERYLRGLWRIAQHADIFDGTGQQYVTPEFSLDGGATWRRTKQGSEWGDFKYSMMDGYVPYVVYPNRQALNPQLIIPPLADRLIVKAVIKSGKILVGAIDPWNYQGTTLDIKVRYAGLNDNVRLYGRALYLGKTTL